MAKAPASVAAGRLNFGAEDWIIRSIMSGKLVSPSRSREPPTGSAVDRLTPLLDRFRVRGSLFHSGALCGTTSFDALPGRAFLHVLRRGEMDVLHPAGEGVPRRLAVREPTLLLYPRPLHHVFVNPPRDGSDFVCATLDFDGGPRHPLVAALPPLVTVALREVEGLAAGLQLLFDETANSRCGSRLIADRLFEVVLVQLLRWLLDRPERAGIGAGLLAGLSDPRLARALVALHESPAQAWTVGRMAERAGLSRAAFAARFRAVTGTTPAAYLGDWRLSLAAARIRSGTPIKQVAAECGFAGAASFSRAFRRCLGESPRGWQRLRSAVREGAAHDASRPGE